MYKIECWDCDKYYVGQTTKSEDARKKFQMLLEYQTYVILISRHSNEHRIQVPRYLQHDV